MPILNIQIGQTGLSGVVPRVVYINTNDTLAQVTTAGYLNLSVQNGFAFSDADMCLVTTKTSQSATVISVGWLEVSHVGANWSLISIGSPGSVTLPTIANHIATYTNVTGGLSEDPSTAISGGSIQAGLSGTAGTLISYPSTAAKGALILAGVANTGNTNTTISNAAMGQATVVSIPDPGATTAKFVLNTGTTTMASGSDLILDKGTGTESSNAVTISKNTGVITTTSLTTAGGATETITLTNTLVSTSSVVIATVGNGTNNATSAVTLTATVTGASTVVFVITNTTAATALNGTLLIKFAVF